MQKINFINGVMNYTGSKFKLLEQILPEMDYTKKYFVDLFTGSFVVGMNVVDKYDKVLANDIIIELIKIHKELLESDEIIEKTKNLCPRKDDKESFLKLRDSFNKDKTPEKLWALMLSSTNNMMRFSQKFLYNQSFGKRTFNDSTQSKIDEFTKYIRPYKNKIIFSSKHFNEIKITKPSMVYIDPPYTETEAGYNSYWKRNDDILLYNYIKELDKNGSSFMLSGVVGEHKNGKRSKLIDDLMNDGYNYKILNFDYENVARKKNSKNSKEIIIEDKWESSNVIKLYSKLYYLVNDSKVEAKNGKVTKNKDKWDMFFLEDLEGDPHEVDNEFLTEIYPKDSLIPVSKLWCIKALNDDKFFSEVQLAQYLKTLNAKEILNFLESTIEKSFTPIEHDFSNSIIFVIGNLDDVYFDSNQMSPDIDAESLYEHTEKITISNVKEALTFKYRPEQISRLGNNHIIYKSFNEKMYKKLISNELDKIVNKIQNKFELKLQFDKSVNDIIYNEGVFPTQGVRPIFSTVTSLIETYIGRIIVDSLKLKINIEKIYWKFKNDEYIILINDKKEIKYSVKLKIDSIRKSKQDDIQALVGVHEAGHVVASVYALNLCPKLVVSRNAEGDGGFTHIDLPEYETKELLLNDIVCLIGGYCAEKLIFGENNITSGSFSDLERSTKTALKIVKEYGMNGLPIQFSTPDFRISSQVVCLNDDDLDKKAVTIIEECVAKCNTILNDNKELLLRIGDYLAKNSKMNANEIKNMVEIYGAKTPEYKTKDNYYDYKKILNKELLNYKKK